MPLWCLFIWLFTNSLARLYHLPAYVREHACNFHSTLARVNAVAAREPSESPRSVIHLRFFSRGTRRGIAGASLAEVAPDRPCVGDFLAQRPVSSTKVKMAVLFSLFFFLLVRSVRFRRFPNLVCGRRPIHSRYIRRCLRKDIATLSLIIAVETTF